MRIPKGYYEDRGTVNAKKRTNVLVEWTVLLFFVHFVCGFAAWMFLCLIPPSTPPTPNPPAAAIFRNPPSHHRRAAFPFAPVSVENSVISQIKTNHVLLFPPTLAIIIV